MLQYEMYKVYHFFAGFFLAFPASLTSATTTLAAAAAFLASRAALFFLIVSGSNLRVN
jgi:hypothetical protein